MCVVLAGWPGISADLYKDNSGSSLKLSNPLRSFLGRGDLKKQMEAETARRRRPRRLLTPLEGREASAAKTEKFIWQIFIFAPLSLLSKSSFFT